MAGVGGAFQRCNACDIECSMDELSCWCCGGLLEAVPVELPNGEFSQRWVHAAMTYDNGVS